MPKYDTRASWHLLSTPVILLAAALLLTPSPPAAGQSIEINGENGTGDATQGELGNDAGWRMIGPPVTGVTAGNLVSPQDGNGSVVEFDLSSNSGMFYGYGSGSFSEISDPSTSLTNGRGYILFLFDDSGTADADPLDPDLTLEFNAGSAPDTGSDVTVDGLDTGASFHLIANPYNTGFRFSKGNSNHLEDGNGTDFGDTGSFRNTIQIWNGGDSSGEDNATAGSYCMFDVTTKGSQQIDGTYGTTSCRDGGQISAWQAFFIERTTEGSSGSVVFKAGGTTNNTRDIIGEKSTRRAKYVRMGLDLSVEDPSGNVVARDGAAALYFHSEATTGVDGYDASKLTPLVYPYATIGPVGPTLDGTEAIKAVESLPRDTALPVTIPLRLKTAGNVEGTATLQASRWEHVPDDWTATLVDTKGTDDPSDDEEHPLPPSFEGYTFQIGSQKQASVNGKTSPPGRVLHPSRTSTKTEAFREHDGPQPYLPASLSMTDRMQRRAKAGNTDPTRFKIRIEGTPLPVELAQFDAVLDGTAAQLRWRTESETNNAGFDVQRRGPDTDGFEALGFVESKASGGTASTPTSYRFQSASLSPGRHVFRLRQKDLDGTTSHSETRAVRVRQDAPLRVRVAPNPVSTQSTLTVRLRSAQEVEAALYDVLGRRVQTVTDQTLPGSQRHKFNLRVGDLPSGTYFLRVRGDQEQITRRVTVLR